jgi:Na+/phosphate symporter
VTAFIAAAGRKAAGKNIAFFSLIFNLAGTVVFTAVFLLVPPAALENFLRKFGPDPKFQLAWFNFLENILSVVLFLPFVPWITRRLERKGKFSLSKCR